jgi:hypothetical protein
MSNHVEPVRRDGNESTNMMGYGQTYPLPSTIQHRNTSYPDTQGYSAYPQRPSHPMSMMQVEPTTNVSAGPSPNRRLMDTQPTQRGPTNQPTDTSSISQDSHARPLGTDGSARQPAGGLIVFAALSRVAEMRDREQDMEEDAQGDEEEFADGLEPMHSEAQPDANADEHVSVEDHGDADGEEPMAGDGQPLFEEDMQLIQDQEHPPSPAPPPNPATPIFSPVVPLKSLEIDDVDMAITPTQGAMSLPAEASPRPQGLHLEGIEGLSFGLKRISHWTDEICFLRYRQ